MNIRQLTEQLNDISKSLTEDYSEELQQVLAGTYEVTSYKKPKKLLVDIVLPEIDKLNKTQLITILNTYGGKDNSLFPSHWKYGNCKEVYPAILAEAVSECDSSENLTDIYNIFYANMDKTLFEDAVNVWKNSLLNTNLNDQGTINTLRDYPDDLNRILDTLAEQYPEFTNRLKAKYNLFDVK